MVLAERIKKVAADHGTNMVKVARALGVKQPQISRTINNERISLKDLEAIAGVIGCDVAEFFMDAGQSPKDGLKCPYCGKRLNIIKGEDL